MFENRICGLCPNQARHVGVFDLRRFECPHYAFVAGRGEGRDGRSIRPVGSAVATRLVEAPRIDAALEETLERGIDRAFAESARVEREKAKRGYVPFVEREGMPQWYWTIVERDVVDQGEEPRGAFPIPAVPLEQVRAIECDRGSYSVPRFSCSRSIETKSALKLPFPNERLPLR